MRALIGAAAALALIGAASQASAQVTGTVDITGSVGERCEFTVNSATIPLGELSGTGGLLDTAQVNGETATLNGWCNGTAAEMTVEANAIENISFVGSPPAGFETIVNYTATATASPASGDVSANDTSVSVGAGAPSLVGVFSSDIDVVLSASSTPGGGKLIAGNYEGSVDVTLTPSP
ncbi:MAG TPA: hypothetical protein VJ748_06495 [Vitreimonas sp.]|jgi:hypothetical protein|nr:hypothetical protein [Vitreimonas sp.]